MSKLAEKRGPGRPVVRTEPAVALNVRIAKRLKDALARRAYSKASTMAAIVEAAVERELRCK